MNSRPNQVWYSDIYFYFSFYCLTLLVLAMLPFLTSEREPSLEPVVKERLDLFLLLISASAAAATLGVLSGTIRLIEAQSTA